MKLDEVETLNDLKEWLKENLPKAEVYEDMYGTLVIRTGLTSSMGGYLHPIEKEGKLMEKCTQCESDRIFLLDAENEECDCGAVYCADCEAEYSKEGELLAFGLVM